MLKCVKNSNVQNHAKKVILLLFVLCSYLNCRLFFFINLGLNKVLFTARDRNILHKINIFYLYYVLNMLSVFLRFMFWLSSFISVYLNKAIDYNFLL